MHNPENKSKKRNVVGDYFVQKEREASEDGEVVARYTLGADLGFIKDENGNKKCVVFECNGHNSGLTIAPRRKDNKGDYFNKMKKEIRTQSRKYEDVAELWENQYIAAKVLEFNLTEYLKDKDLYISTWKNDKNFDKYFVLMGPLFELIDLKDNFFISVLQDFFEIFKKNKDPLELIKSLSLLYKNLLSQNLSDKYSLFIELLEIVTEDWNNSSNLPVMRGAYTNNEKAEQILDDKKLQQPIIPIENLIPEFDPKTEKPPRYDWWVMKPVKGSRGLGFIKIHHKDLLERFKNEPDLLDKYLVQEMVQTIGADNAEFLDNNFFHKKHSAMRLLLDLSVRRRVIKDENGNDKYEYFAVVETGNTTHNIYPRIDGDGNNRGIIFNRLPAWGQIEPVAGAKPIESSTAEIKMGEVVVKQMALNLFFKTHPELAS
jgi:hypothetical protein